MSDDATPRPETPSAATSSETAGGTPTGGPRWGNRGWLLLVAAALVVGCFLGAGTVAIGAFVTGHLARDRDRVYVDHGRKGDRHEPAPPPIRKQPPPVPPRLPKVPASPSPSS